MHFEPVIEQKQEEEISNNSEEIDKIHQEIQTKIKRIQEAAAFRIKSLEKKYLLTKNQINKQPEETKSNKSIVKGAPIQIINDNESYKKTILGSFVKSLFNL